MGHGLEKVLRVAFPHAWATRQEGWGNPGQAYSDFPQDAQIRAAESQPQGLG